MDLVLYGTSAGLFPSESGENQIFNLFKPLEVTIFYIPSERLCVFMDPPILRGQINSVIFIRDL